MTIHVALHNSGDLVELVRLERHAFAAKLRLARAVFGWSQGEFGFRVGLTQRAIHKLEQGETEPRRATVRAIEMFWQDQGIEFEDLADGGFRVAVRAPVLERSKTVPLRRHDARRFDLGVTSTGRRSMTHRA
jgi:transcriptional regulator with XRE-family HTH domain